VPLRRLVLAAGPDGGPRTIRWFYRVRNLEYHRGIREAGGIPGRWPVRVLCYHALHHDDGSQSVDQYSVSLREFRRQIRFLARWFRFVSLNEVVELVRGDGLVPQRAILVTFDDCYAGIADALPTLQKYGVPAAAFAVSSLLGETNAWDPPSFPRRPLLDGAGLHHLADGGVAIGSHTRTHPMLNQLTPADLAGELAGSAADLAELGLPTPEALAYPYGEQDATVRTATAAAGYRAAFTVEPGQAVPGGDPYAIPRIEIYGAETGWRFLRKVIAAGRPW
jgi:peptidoglycan/xylan/chitin deacetylase (PgdA/CDA1 family)